MLDIQFIRAHAEQVQEAAASKGLAFRVEELISADDRRRELLMETERLRGERNRRSAQIAVKLREGRTEEAEACRQEALAMQGRLKELERSLRAAEEEFKRQMLLAPNLMSPDTPEGRSDADNVELRRVGELPTFTFDPLDHVQLGERLGLIDIPRGVKMSGARQYTLRGAGALLHRAVQQLALDLLLDKGFTPWELPMMVKEEPLIGSGFFPSNREQTFGLPEERLWLSGTAEVPLVSLFAGETLDLSEPVKLAAASVCCRKEVGSAGRDVHGLYRVHQFAKVEQVVICRADLELGVKLLEQMTANAEELLRLLELPYRVVAVCSGDMSQKNYKQYDIETWMPSRGGYGETHSASLLLDFQARRSRIRYRGEDGRLQYAFTLNNTMVATPRILIPLLEAHQREDGSIRIPAALQPYMRGMTELAGQSL